MDDVFIVGFHKAHMCVFCYIL